MIIAIAKVKYINKDAHVVPAGIIAATFKVNKGRNQGCALAHKHERCFLGVCVCIQGVSLLGVYTISTH